jgi:hypothetical protein
LDEVEKKYELKPKAKDIRSFINIEAVWAGGESLVGKDKEIGNFFDRYQRNKDKESILKEAKENLTKVGYKQLLLSIKNS